ncbi:hypothetical protein Hamer_G016630 [Homarus americanus]|uniref:Uncharacterized protein n=1 Tax=Homarus americanus TaxID=6706 RepID=A0A8J5MPQ6_HOMAM|nr:hypothetical protein Hamer_G016630 [Homarus americanus]
MGRVVGVMAAVLLVALVAAASECGKITCKDNSSTESRRCLHLRIMGRVVGVMAAVLLVALVAAAPNGITYVNMCSFGVTVCTNPHLELERVGPCEDDPGVDED